MAATRDQQQYQRAQGGDGADGNAKAFQNKKADQQQGQYIPACEKGGPITYRFHRGLELAGVILRGDARTKICQQDEQRSEEHTSELQSLMRISYAVFCLKKKKQMKII